MIDIYKNSLQTVFNVMQRLIYMQKCDVLDDFQFQLDRIDLNFPGQYLKHQPKFVKDQIYRIKGEIDSYHYSYDKLILTVMTEFACGKKFTYEFVNYGNIIKTVESYTVNQLKKDQLILIEINKATHFGTIEDWFKIKDNGTSQIYDLIVDGSISVCFYVKYAGTILTRIKENVFLDLKSPEHLRFERICKLIKTILVNTNK